MRAKAFVLGRTSFAREGVESRGEMGNRGYFILQARTL